MRGFQGDELVTLSGSRRHGSLASMLQSGFPSFPQRTDSRASIGDDHEIPYLLASRGADLVLKNKAGKTPLDYAPKAIASLLKKFVLFPLASATLLFE